MQTPQGHPSTNTLWPMWSRDAAFGEGSSQGRGLASTQSPRHLPSSGVHLRPPSTPLTHCQLPSGTQHHPASLVPQEALRTPLVTWGEGTTHCYCRALIPMAVGSRPLTSHGTNPMGRRVWSISRLGSIPSPSVNPFPSAGQEVTGREQRLDLRRLQFLPRDNLETQLKLSGSALGCSRARGTLRPAAMAGEPWGEPPGHTPGKG